MADFKELLVDMNELLTPAAAPQPESEPSKATTLSGGEQATSIDQRLRTLDRLLSKGLITEEEYKLKRQQLLDQL